MDEHMIATVAEKTGEGIVDLTDSEFRLFSNLVYDRFGVNLTDKKKALVKGRLNSMLKTNGIGSFGAYYDRVVKDPTGRGLLELIDRLSTNHSFFFREQAHFGFLKEVVLPEVCSKLEAEGSRDLRIWSAGCAAGEEAYTLAMVLHDYFGPNIGAWDAGVLGTDISVSSLETAAGGVYQSAKLGAIPGRYKPFVRKSGDDEFAMDERLKKLITFRRLNLMRDEYPFKGRFQIVFCRNVMIYFDKETKDRLIARIRRYLKKDGYLFIGHSETLGRNPKGYRYIMPTVYQRS